jgi:PH (Pleckstrin Homology) domain-containing protein
MTGEGARSEDQEGPTGDRRYHRSGADPRHPPPPTPVDLWGRWPQTRQIVVDGLRIGAAVGGVLAALVDVSLAGVGLVVGAVVGGLLGQGLGRARHRLRVDQSGVLIGQLGRTRHVPWTDVAAFGCREDHHGRSGRMLGLVVCCRGELLPVEVPAMTWTASGFRMGGEHPIDRLRVHRDEALDPIRPWAEAAGVLVIEGDVDAWWDRA